MLAKKYRLPVQNVFGKRGKELRFSILSAKYFPNGLLYGRFGAVIRKGLVKKASTRNEIRRAVFHAIETLEGSRILAGFDVLLIVRGPAEQCTRNEFLRETNLVISGILQK